MNPKPLSADLAKALHAAGDEPLPVIDPANACWTRFVCLRERPNMNAHLERFFGSLKSECLNQLILFGERATRKAVRQYLEHYHADRCHQDWATS